MKFIAWPLAFALFSSSALAQSTPDPIADAERAFDAYTHEHGFTHGFHAWSAPGALAIGADGAQPIHERLSEALANNPSEADAPSLLRWWPGYTGLSSAGDMGYDYGGWTNGDAADCAATNATALPKSCGLYFTIWQKQPDGTWKWVVDTGAGPDFASGLPPRDHVLPHRPDESAKAPAGSATATFELALYESLLNDDITQHGADKAYKGLISNGAIIADGASVPARHLIDYDMALAVRPTALVWKKDSQTISPSGDMAWTTGHTVDTEGKTAGYYVRVWQRWAPPRISQSLDPNAKAYWAISADIYHAATRP